MTATRDRVEVRKIDATELRSRLLDQSVRLLDVRSPAEFESAHVEGSYNVPLDLLREHRTELADHLDEDVVLMCLSGTRSSQAAEALSEAGVSNLRVLDGGIESWRSAGHEVVEGRQTWDLERQVRFAAGSLVTAAVVGSAAYPPLKWAAAGVGGGLVVAAVTNTCAMGAALMKMPWNRTSQTLTLTDVVDQLTDGTAEPASSGR